MSNCRPNGRRCGNTTALLCCTQPERPADLLATGIKAGSCVWATGESINAIHKFITGKGPSDWEICRFAVSWAVAAISSGFTTKPGETQRSVSATENPVSGSPSNQQSASPMRTPLVGGEKTELGKETYSENIPLPEFRRDFALTENEGKPGSLRGGSEQKEIIDSVANTWRKIIKPGSVTLVIGKSGAGKSSTGHKTLEYVRSRGPCVVVGLPRSVQKELPDWIGIIPEISQAPFGTSILLDEGSLLFSSKESMSEQNRRLLSDIVLARQREHTLIIISQDSSYIDRNILRALDTLVIKEPAPLQMRMDRPEIRSYLKEAAQAFSQLKGDKRPYSYIAFSPSGFTGVVSIPKASYWSEKLSKAYAAGIELEQGEMHPFFPKRRRWISPGSVTDTVCH